MIEPFEEWCFKAPKELTNEQKRWLLENRPYLAEYVKRAKNDITNLALPEFKKAVENGELCVFSIPDMLIESLKWMAMLDMDVVQPDQAHFEDQ